MPEALVSEPTHGRSARFRALRATAPDKSYHRYFGPRLAPRLNACEKLGTDELCSRRPPQFHYAWIAAGVTFLTLLVAAGATPPGVMLQPFGNEFQWSRATVSSIVSFEHIFARVDWSVCGGAVPSVWTAPDHDGGDAAAGCRLWSFDVCDPILAVCRALGVCGGGRLRDGRHGARCSGRQSMVHGTTRVGDGCAHGEHGYRALGPAGWRRP